MSLTLKDGVYYVRTEIGELQEFLWSDDQIIFDLNHAARRMCSKAQVLTKFESLALQLNSTTGTQEAALEFQVDKVKSVKYFSGQLYDLEPHEWKSLQIGAATGSIPRWYYLKTGTRELTPQSTSTSNIVEYPIGPNGPWGDQFRTVLGVWPIPPDPAELSVWYSYVHPWMQNPLDPCAVEENFLEGWASAAIARCYRIQKATAEAELYAARHEKSIEDFRIYASAQKQGDKPARYGTVVEPWRQSASSSVIFIDPTPGGI